VDTSLGDIGPLDNFSTIPNSGECTFI